MKESRSLTSPENASSRTILDFREGSSINKSLLAIYNVISRLSKGESFVSYRDSKLTRLLQSQLGGNSCTAVICTLSPLKEHIQESLNTLRFGMCAGGVKNAVKLNIKTEEKNTILEQIDRELQTIEGKKEELEAEVQVANTSLEESQKLLESQVQTILELQQAAEQIRAVEKQIQEMKKAKTVELEEALETLRL